LLPQSVSRRRTRSNGQAAALPVCSCHGVLEERDQGEASSDTKAEPAGFNEAIDDGG
jgi:hypothetical protein